MNNGTYSIHVRPGQEDNGGVVRLTHGTQYVLDVGNTGNLRCDAEIYIDGKHVGTWRVPPLTVISIERPIHSDGCFTFYCLGSCEAKAAGIVATEILGQIRATFKPELLRTSLNSQRVERRGGTGFSGHSEQQFTKVQQIPYDAVKFQVLTLRLEAAPSPSVMLPPPRLEAASFTEAMRGLVIGAFALWFTYWSVRNLPIRGIPDHPLINLFLLLVLAGIILPLSFGLLNGVLPGKRKP